VQLIEVSLQGTAVHFNPGCCSAGDVGDDGLGALIGWVFSTVRSNGDSRVGMLFSVSDGGVKGWRSLALQ
jgi:hypothetical protein